MALPDPNFPVAVWDGNEQETTHDGAADTARAQAGDYNENSAEVIALQNWTRAKKSIVCINKTGGALAAGKLVGISGYDSATGLPTVAYAWAVSGANARRAIGILPQEIADDAKGEVLLRGLYGPLDTSGKTTRDPVWNGNVGGAAGSYLYAPPEWPCSVQRVGEVAVVDASDGYLYIDPSSMNDIRVATQRIGGLSGSDDRFLFIAPCDCHILQVRLLPDTATAGSDGSNNWSFQVYDHAVSVNLLSAAKNTNGSELAADTDYVLDPDQNTEIAADSPIELQVTKTGSPTALTDAEIMVQIEWTPHFDN